MRDLVDPDDGENRAVNESASKANDAHKARQLPKIDSTGVCVDATQLEAAVRDMKKMMCVDDNKEVK